MRFFETNNVDDPGFELSPEEVAARFWQSEDGEAWANDAGVGHYRLDRLAADFISRKLGGCDRDTMDEAIDAIIDARPKAF